MHHHPIFVDNEDEGLHLQVWFQSKLLLPLQSSNQLFLLQLRDLDLRREASSNGSKLKTIQAMTKIKGEVPICGKLLSASFARDNPIQFIQHKKAHINVQESQPNIWQFILFQFLTSGSASNFSFDTTRVRKAIVCA